MAPSSRSIVFRQSQLDHMLRHPSGTVGQSLQRFGRKATLEAKSIAAAELQRRTGEYHDGFESHVETGGINGLRLRIKNRAKHATYIEAGTRAHVIVPRTARVLHWKDASGDHFATLVHHPGTRAYRILERAVRRAVGRGL